MLIVLCGSPKVLQVRVIKAEDLTHQSGIYDAGFYSASYDRCAIIFEVFA